MALMPQLCVLSNRVARRATLLILAAAWSLGLAPSLGAASEPETPTASIEVGSWLVAGPVATPLPAFADEVPYGAEDPLKPAALLPETPRDPLQPWPAAGAIQTWAGAQPTAWRTVTSASVDLGAAEGDGPRLAYLAAYVEVDRFVAAKLEVASGHLVRVFVDGEQVAEKTAADGSADEDGEADGEGEGEDDGEEEADAGSEAEESEDAEDDADEAEVGAEGDEDADRADEDLEPPGAEGSGGQGTGSAGAAEAAGESGPGTASADIDLTTGKHLILIVAVLDPQGPAAWTVSATLEVDEDRAASVAISASPERGVRIADLLDTPGIEGVEVSADGELVAVTLQRPQVPSDDRVAWVEILKAADGGAVHTIRLPGSVRGFIWAPTGRRYAYRTSGDGGKGTIWLGDLTDGSLAPLGDGIEGLGDLLWAPDGRSLFVTISVEAETDDRGAKRVRSLPDRWGGFRDIDSVWQVSTADGSRRRLTAGGRGVSLLDVAPDGSRLLVSRTAYVLERPFATGEIYELDLATLAPRVVTRGAWLGGGGYSPDGETILVTAGPSAFGGAGRAVPEGVIPNEYDGQVYLVDRDGGDVRAVTRDFDPGVDAALWSPHDGAIYLRVTEGERSPIYRLDPASGRFEKLDTPLDAVDGIALARRASTMAYFGSSLQESGQVYAVRLGAVGTARRGAPAAASAARRLLMPAQETWGQVRFGRVEDFDFTTADGTTIPGRLYYPLGFDPSAEPDRKVPLIVYYYGGVSPTGREFGGRYPKNLWAANGYAVYVLQPSGAVGFGQELSARHVNDWGKRVSGEILQGVREVIAAHPFLDGTKVGNFGGSYGGFMTMLLLTQSDAFAAAISHAGISDIASYWGAGWWGYLYSAVAGADSYPWNNPELYVGQSPLYAADEIDTPLLLLHGMADPNVPPGESDQMFAALRLLGKEVEYIQIEGEAHWILTYPKRVLWWETILAWFDKQLKGQPEHWEELWGKDLDRSGP